MASNYRFGSQFAYRPSPDYGPYIFITPADEPASQSKQMQLRDVSRLSLSDPYFISQWSERSDPSVIAPTFTDPFDYTPLPSPILQGWIRLIKIFPTKSRIVLHELTVTNLATNPQYKALSYAWGDHGETRKISIVQNQHQGWLKVPVSLHDALETLRDETEELLVWADSVCINQQDSLEKSMQLPQIPDIYGKAEQVVIWLGAEKDDSKLAQKLLRNIAYEDVDLGTFSELGSVVALFDRDYWSRLWVVQEILHAKDIWVYCGSSRLHWNYYTRSSKWFRSRKNSLSKIPALTGAKVVFTRLVTSQHRLSPLQILCHHGPASILHMHRTRKPYMDDDISYLLQVMRLSRTKLASDPKDKVYGILGILPVELQDRFRIDYTLPVKDIYTDVVEVLLEKGKIDVICESIHFPPHISNLNLPSWVPDWSYDPATQSLASLPFSFSAGILEVPFFTFIEESMDPPRRNKLVISGRRIGTVEVHGMAVNTHSRAADYCMAFLQWRALLLQHFGINLGSLSESEECRRGRAVSCDHQRRFCLTLSLGQPTRTGSDGEDLKLVGKEQEWLNKCYCVFAKTIKARLPMLPIDEDLKAFAEMGDDMGPEGARLFLQESFAEYMMGRCFCITDSGSLGLGTGAMARGDVVVVLYGSSTPVLLRPEGSGSRNVDGWPAQEYRFVGDAYIHGYMDGEAKQQGSREEFVLH